MTKRQKMWIYSPRKKPVPDLLKAEVQSRANELVENFIKPEHIKPPPKDIEWNYIVDIYTKWHGSYFYFCAKYCSPGPNAISPSFETKFARMGYFGNNRFNLSYMRHTGRWWEIYTDLSLEECLTAIKDEPHFLP